MAGSSADPHDEIYRDLDLWLRRLKEIDHLLEATVPTLIDISDWALKNGWSSVPLYISDRATPPNRHYLLVQAICASTIQRLYSVRRRFAWLGGDRAAKLEALN